MTKCSIPKEMSILWKDHGIIMEGSWKDHGRIMEGSWKDHGRIMEGSWKDHGRIIIIWKDRERRGYFIFREWPVVASNLMQLQF